MVNFSDYTTVVIATHSLIVWPAAVVCRKLLTFSFQISFLLFSPHTSPLCFSFGFGFCVHTLRHNNQLDPLCDTWACWQKYPPPLARVGCSATLFTISHIHAHVYTRCAQHCCLAWSAALCLTSWLLPSLVQIQHRQLGMKGKINSWLLLHWPNPSHCCPIGKPDNSAPLGAILISKPTHLPLSQNMIPGKCRWRRIFWRVHCLSFIFLCGKDMIAWRELMSV